jgi:hypothetical protein
VYIIRHRVGFPGRPYASNVAGARKWVLDWPRAPLMWIILPNVLQ